MNTEDFLAFGHVNLRSFIAKIFILGHIIFWFVFFFAAWVSPGMSGVEISRAVAVSFQTDGLHLPAISILFFSIPIGMAISLYRQLRNSAHPGLYALISLPGLAWLFSASFNPPFWKFDTGFIVVIVSILLVVSGDLISSGDQQSAAVS